MACISFFIKSHQFEVFEGLFRFGLPLGVKVFIQIRQLWNLASAAYQISHLFSRKFSVSTSFMSHLRDYPEPSRPCFLWIQKQNTTGRFLDLRGQICNSHFGPFHSCVGEGWLSRVDNWIGKYMQVWAPAGFWPRSCGYPGPSAGRQLSRLDATVLFTARLPRRGRGNHWQLLKESACGLEKMHLGLR